MATTRIKQKLSQIVRSQFPEFVQSDHNKFITFLESYYKFVEQDQNSQELIQNILDYNNIDFTTSAFIKYFIKNYAEILPDTLLADKKLAVKRIKDIYEAKGSTLSFQLFFRIVFNQEIRVNFPYENVLIPSGGNFVQRRSLRILTSSLASNVLISDLTDRFLRTTVNNQEFRTPILEVNEINSTLTEMFLDVNFLAPSYTLEDEVTITDATEDGGNVIFTGNIKPTTTSVSILESGSGFKQGQIYNIILGAGSGTKILVDNVSSTGSINEVSILTFGHSYTNDFTVDLDKDKVVNETTLQRTLTDNTTGFLSHGNVFNVTTATTQTFGNNTTANVSGTSALTDNSKATLSFTVGALAIFPGEFTTNKGFISEPDIKLQNDLLFQPFAYELVTGLDINNFRDVILDTIHPAGQRLFNNRELSDVLDVRANVTTTSSDVQELTLFDSSEPSEEITDIQLVFGIDLVDSTGTITDTGNVVTNGQSYFADPDYVVNQDPNSADSYIDFTTETF